MRLLLITCIAFLGCLSLQGSPQDSIKVVVVCERSFNGEILIGIQGVLKMKSGSFQKDQIQAFSFQLNNVSFFNIEIWEKRKLFFGYRKYLIPINVNRKNELLVLDRDSIIKKRFRYNWYWVKDTEEIRTVVHED